MVGLKTLAGLEGAWRALRVSGAWRIKCLGAGNDFIRNLRGILSPRSGGIGKYLLTLECGLLGDVDGVLGGKKRTAEARRA